MVQKEKPKPLSTQKSLSAEIAHALGPTLNYANLKLTDLSNKVL